MSTKGTKRARSSPAKGTPTLQSLWQRPRQSGAPAPAPAPARGAAAAAAPPAPPARPPARPPAPAPAPAPAAGSFASSAPATAPECRHVELQSGTGNLRFWPSLLADDAQKRLFKELTHPDLRPIAEADPSDGGRWAQREITVAGREVLQPRLTASFGKKGVSYKYSGKSLKAALWDDMPAIQEILSEVERVVGRGPGFYNYVLLNWYRDGDDYIGWHADDEGELDKGAPIASVSLGEERKFLFRRKTNHSRKMEFLLRGGSLLTMEGSTQKHWQHHVPKRTVKEGGKAGRAGKLDPKQRTLSWASFAGSGSEQKKKKKDGCTADKNDTGGGVLHPAPTTEEDEVVVVEGPAAGGGGGGGGGRGGQQEVEIMTGRINLTFRRVKRK